MMASESVSIPMACQQVFAIPELLELILSHCQPKMLYRLQAVNSSWQHSISRSLYMQRLLFKRMLAGTLSENLDWCRAWGVMQANTTSLQQATPSEGAGYLTRFCLHPVLARHLGGVQAPRHLDLDSLQLLIGPATLLVSLQGPLFANLDAKAAAATPQPSGSSSSIDASPASWEDNVLSQPAATRVLMKLWRERGHDVPISDPDMEAPRHAKEKFYFCTVGHAGGVTLGMVSRAVRSYVWRHQYPGIKYVAAELLLRFH